VYNHIIGLATQKQKTMKIISMDDLSINSTSFLQYRYLLKIFCQFLIRTYFIVSIANNRKKRKSFCTVAYGVFAPLRCHLCYCSLIPCVFDNSLIVTSET